MAIHPVTRPRVLVIAEAANPEWVSVPLVGWSLAQALCGVAEVHLVTQIRNREAILRAGLTEGVDFTAIDSETFARPAWRLAEVLRMGEGKGWTMVQAINALSYPWFERLVWRRFGDQIKGGAFDIVHRVTPLSPTAPSLLAARCRAAGVPFLLGPLNGGVPWPKGFEVERRAEREWLAPLRSAYKLLPGRRATLGHAAAVIVGSGHTGRELPPEVWPKRVYIPENGIAPERFCPGPRPDHAALLRAGFVGRMVPYKGPDMALEACRPLLAAGRMTLEMIGDGPMLPALEAQAKGLPGVTFHGWQPHENVQDILRRCDLLAFPSIREFGGGVVLEAMALGVVPVVVDYAGPGELVTPETGFAVPCTDRAGIVAAFRDRLERLATDKTPLAALSEAAQARVASHFLWERKAQQVRAVYDWVLAGQSGPAPEVFAPLPEAPR